MSALSADTKLKTVVMLRSWVRQSIAGDCGKTASVRHYSGHRLPDIQARFTLHNGIWYCTFPAAKHALMQLSLLGERMLSPMYDCENFDSIRLDAVDDPKRHLDHLADLAKPELRHGSAREWK
jgi:hypothetical protein